MPFWYVLSTAPLSTGQFQNMSLQGCMLPPPYQTLPPTCQAYEPTGPPNSLKNNLTGIAGGQNDHLNINHWLTQHLNVLQQVNMANLHNSELQSSPRIRPCAITSDEDKEC